MEIEISTNASGELYLKDDRGRTSRLYRFREALMEAGVSAVTYYRWVKDGRIADTRYRDKGQWRVFTEDELAKLVDLSKLIRAEARRHDPRASDGRAADWRNTT